MLRIRASSAVVAPTTTSVVAAATGAAVLRTSIRHYEYPGVGITQKAPVHARGEQIPSTYEWTQVSQRDGAAAFAQTGESTSVAYDADTMYNPQAEVAKLSKKYSAFKGHQKYVLNDVTNKQVQIAVTLLEKTDKEAVWAALFTDYPSLKEVLDEETKTTMMNLYESGIANASDTAMCSELAAPIVRDLLERKCFPQPYWWRFHEKLVLGMSAKGVSDGTFHVRTANLVAERFTKTLYNTFNELPWASDEYVSPLFYDVCGARQCVESGHFH